MKKMFSFLFFAFSFLFLCKALFLSFLPDFTNYYYGAKHIVNNENPYIQDSNYFTDQSYPPFALILFMWFSLLSIDTASIVWTCISLILLLVNLFFIYKIHKEAFFAPGNLLLSSFVFITFPVKFSLGMGQINFLVLMLLTLTFYFLNKKKDDLSGFFLGFTLAIKFFPLLLIPYFVWLKNWKILRSFILALSFVTFLTFIFFSFQTVNQYFAQILPDLLFSWKGDYYNQSVTGFVMRIMQDPMARQVFRVLIVFILALGLFLVFFKEKKDTKEILNLKISAIITLSLLINSFSWQHHFVWLLIPYFVIFYYIKNNNLSKKYFIILGISYILGSINFRTPSILPVILQSHVFYGAFLLYCLNLRLLVKKLDKTK